MMWWNQWDPQGSKIERGLLRPFPLAGGPLPCPGGFVGATAGFQSGPKALNEAEVSSTDLDAQGAGTGFDETHLRLEIGDWVLEIGDVSASKPG